MYLARRVLFSCLCSKSWKWYSVVPCSTVVPTTPILQFTKCGCTKLKYLALYYVPAGKHSWTKYSYMLHNLYALSFRFSIWDTVKGVSSNENQTLWWHLISGLQKLMHLNCWLFSKNSLCYLFYAVQLFYNTISDFFIYNNNYKKAI